MDTMILIDLETQNFPVESGIYEVACLVVNKYKIVDKLYLGKEIPGYTGKKTYGFGFYDISEDKEYINKFKEFINKYPYPIVAHNCPFDRKFLVYYKWIAENYPAYCSMRAIRMADNTLGSYALNNLVKHYNISDEVEHTAMSDIENVYKILKILKPQIWISVGTNYNKKFYSKVKARSLEDIDLNIDTTSILKGEVVCFTGKSDYPRNIMQEIAIKNGAEICDTINSKTTLLVVGLDAGSKLYKAQEKGISIISNSEFIQFLNLKGKDIITENENFVEFNTLEEKLQKLKEWKLISDKAADIKPIMYKGVFTESETTCEIIGYIFNKNKSNCINAVYETAVIVINSKTHKINPAYLKQMQNKNFSRYNSNE